MYSKLIRETVAKMGRIGANPRHAEAWMRLEYGTLDHLGGPTWDRAIREALACMDASTADENENLAKSYGLKEAA